MMEVESGENFFSPGRSKPLFQTRVRARRMAAAIKRHPAEYLRRLYFDALVLMPKALRHPIAPCGVSQILTGTDSPIGWTNVAVDRILGRQAILGGNVAKLLRITS